MPTPATRAAYTHVFWDMGGTIVNTYPELDAALADVINGLGQNSRRACGRRRTTTRSGVLVDPRGALLSAKLMSLP